MSSLFTVKVVIAITIMIITINIHLTWLSSSFLNRQDINNEIVQIRTVYMQL